MTDSRDLIQFSEHPDGSMSVEPRAATLAEQYASTAEFYRTYAAGFEPGSMGYAGNMAEAAKYAYMAERFGSVDTRARNRASMHDGRESDG